MPDETQPAPHTLSFRTQCIVLAVIVSVACASLGFFFSRGLIHLYGDSLTHLEGARRIWDSRTPGYAEIGTVWLPVPHLLMSLPAQNNFLWRTGLAGGIVSTLAFIWSCWLIFQLSARLSGSLAAGVVALAGFMLSPNMLYLASTALTEPLALLFVLLMAHELDRFRETGKTRRLILAALAAFTGTLTRYEVWSLLPFAALFAMGAGRGHWKVRVRSGVYFSLITGTGPVLWVLHNAYRFENPLAFYNGPASAKGQYAYQLATTAFRLPTDGSHLVALRYYLEDLRLVIGIWPLALALLGILAWAVDASRRSKRAVALILLVPLPFHVHAMATAAVPLYVPTLFPNAYWNLRLGAEMLPAAALFPSFLLPRAAPTRLRHWVMGFLLGCIGLQHAWTAHFGAAELAVAKEGVLNSPCRNQRQQVLTEFLRANYRGEVILLAAGRWPCALPELGIPLRNTLSDASPEFWKTAAIHPQETIEWIVRGNDDPVDWLMRAHPEAFRDYDIVLERSVSGEGKLTIYRRGAGSKISEPMPGP
jgi:hypothetical protein